MPNSLSFREYIEQLRALGELQEIDKEVDWNLEIGAITRRCYELGAPAPLFNSIKGIERGFRALGAPAGISRQPGLYLSRVALSLGLDPKAGGKEIIDAFIEARGRKPLPPERVETGPCKENILQGDAVNLLRFPSPLIHNGDGGRYIGTYATVVAQTPDGTWTNWSNARVMVIDERRMTGIVHPLQHLGQIHGMWKAIGKPMPFAVCLGVPPLVSFVSGMPLPAFENESDYTGAFAQAPVEVVRCETVDLMAPATSEIVIEGYLSDTETAMEGPFGEYAGYLWPGPGTMRPVYNVTCITHRNDPILPVVAAGEPVEEDHTVQGIPSAAEVLIELKALGIPVTMVWTTLESANHWLVVTIPIGWRHTPSDRGEDLCRKIGAHVFEHSKYGAVIPKILVITDDVDASNTNEVIWAFATRCHPGTGTIPFDNENTSPLVAFLKSSEKIAGKTAKVVYNCLPPDEWGDTLPSRCSFRHNYPKSLQDAVVENWSSYGFIDK